MGREFENWFTNVCSMTVLVTEKKGKWHKITWKIFFNYLFSCVLNRREHRKNDVAESNIEQRCKSRKFVKWASALI